MTKTYFLNYLLTKNKNFINKAIEEHFNGLTINSVYLYDNTSKEMVYMVEYVNKFCLVVYNKIKFNDFCFQINPELSEENITWNWVNKVFAELKKYNLVMACDYKKSVEKLCKQERNKILKDYDNKTEKFLNRLTI